MTWADNEHRDEIDLLRFSLTGDQAQAWSRLQEKIFRIIDSITTRIERSTDCSPGSTTSNEVAKDVVRIAVEWAKAKLERPTLENEKMRAEIAAEYAEAKRRLAEAGKLDAEACQVRAKTEHNSLLHQLDVLERCFKLVGVMAHATFVRDGADAHLLIGPRPDQIGQALGDKAIEQGEPPT